MWLSSSAIIDFGDGVYRILTGLLSSIPSLRVTVYRERALSPRLLSLFDRLVASYPERLILTDSISMYLLPVVLRQHDWTWIPTTRADFGIDAMVARSCGTPVIAWQVPPFETCLSHGADGIHIPCQRSNNWFGAPRAIPTVKMTERILGDALVDPLLCDRFRRGTSFLDGRRKVFEAFWAKVWHTEVHGG